MPFGRPHQLPISFERENGYAKAVIGTRIDTSNNSHRDKCTAFQKVTVSTAICDVCNARNNAGTMRCYDCGWQTCMRCARGRHGPVIAQCADDNRGTVDAVHANGSSTSNDENDSGSVTDSTNNSDSNIAGTPTAGNRSNRDGDHDETGSVVEAANALMAMNREALDVLQREQDGATLSIPSQGSIDARRQQKRVPEDNLLQSPRKVHFSPQDGPWLSDKLALWTLVHVACIERSRPGHDRAAARRDISTSIAAPAVTAMQPVHVVQNPSSSTDGIQQMNDISSGRSGSANGNDNAQPGNHKRANALVGCWLETQLNKNLHGGGGH